MENRDRKTVLINEGDLEDVSQYRWFQGKVGYPATQSNLLLHTLLMGKQPRGMVVDHISGDVLDNRRINLQIISSAKNIWKKKNQSNNTSGYRGVCYRKKYDDYTAHIAKNKRSFHIGVFATAIEAARAYNKKAQELFGEFAVLNKVD